MIDTVKALLTLLGLQNALFEFAGSRGLMGPEGAKILDQVFEKVILAVEMLGNLLHQHCHLLVERIFFELLNLGPADSCCREFVEDRAGRVIFEVEKGGIGKRNLNDRDLRAAISSLIGIGTDSSCQIASRAW